MTAISVRVDKDLKRRMNRLKHVNWSEVLRQAIIRTLDGKGERNLARAVLLNERNVLVPDEGFESTKVIREWRRSARWKW